MKATFLKQTPLTDTISSFTFDCDQPILYEAGQFIQLSLPHQPADDRGQKRWFTLSSAPTEPEITITTKFAGDKASSFKKELFALKPGTLVDMVEPEGDFVLPKDENLQLIFIAGGMGITPFHSIVKYLADKNLKRDITLFYAVQSEAEMIFMDLFTDYGVKVTTSVGERFTTESLMKAIGDPAGKLIYLSGPEPMVEALTDSLKAAGLPADQLQSDYFPGYENLYSS